MKFTFDADIFSDLHKEARGFRPRNHRFYHPETTDVERQEIWDAMLIEHENEMIREDARKNEAIIEFENLIQDTIGLGAPDRETAIRWLAQAEDTADDAGFLCYLLGIPYTYEGEIASALR